jgi:hypothetical protein
MPLHGLCGAALASLATDAAGDGVAAVETVQVGGPISQHVAIDPLRVEIVAAQIAHFRN